MTSTIKLQYLPLILKDKKRKSLGTILYELILFGIKKKELPANYFGKFLYRKGASSIDDYLSVKETKEIMKYEQFHRFIYSSLLQKPL